MNLLTFRPRLLSALIIVSISSSALAENLNAIVKSSDSTVVETFHPRTDNIIFKLTEQMTKKPSISVFTELAEITFKDSFLQAEKVFTLLNWIKDSEQPPAEAISYSRKSHFGSWARKLSDKKCYNIRARVLMRDSLKPVVYKENNCTVAEGLWKDPYSDQELTQADEIQIDHMVPLKEAYVSGAYKWTPRARCLYGNYMGYNFHLLPVYGEENNNKGDQTPEDYMPTNKSYACTYLKNWLYIKAIWGLSMSESEAQSVDHLISENNCDKSTFVISAKDFTEQALFVQQNKDLCKSQYNQLSK